jgi:hypothetical protein
MPFSGSKGVYVFENHDIKFLFGDLNFRVNGTYEKTMEHLKSIQPETKGEVINELLKIDQLSRAKDEFSWLEEFNEMPITFLPTYKYESNTNDYDTSEKKRVPSW